MSPSEEAIKKVMEETKMDYMQAYYHLKYRPTWNSQSQRSLLDTMTLCKSHGYPARSVYDSEFKSQDLPGHSIT